MAVLSADYFAIPEEEIKNLESVLTIVGGKVVYAAAEFSNIAPPELPVSPDWSPVEKFGGYAQSEEESTVGATASHAMSLRNGKHSAAHKTHQWILGDKGLWSLGCDCFAF